MASAIRAATVHADMNERLAPLCRLVFNFRLIVLVITVFSIPQERGNTSPLVAALLVATAASFLPLRFWNTFSPLLLRHPAFLAVDLLLAMLILTVTGPDNPFFFFTLGTALLSGVLYGTTGAVVFSTLLVVTYEAGLAFRAQVADGAEGFQMLFGFPALFPICAAAGAAIRTMIERQKATEEGLAASARTAAIERERARIAREMHDSLAKSIHGIGLQAAALRKWVARDPARAERDAIVISEAAQTAAAEARELIRDLRLESPDTPLSESATALAGQWSEQSGVAVAVDAADVDCECPERRWELLNILKEGLRNIERHAHANKVRVALTQSDKDIRLEVSDDGRGFETADLGRLQRYGHFGLVGMAERAERVGGRLGIESAPGRGTTIVATVPLAIGIEGEG